jgi:hypothetical protein
VPLRYKGSRFKVSEKKALMCNRTLLLKKREERKRKKKSKIDKTKRNNSLVNYRIYFYKKIIRSTNRALNYR